MAFRFSKNLLPKAKKTENNKCLHFDILTACNSFHPDWHGRKRLIVSKNLYVSPDEFEISLHPSPPQSLPPKKTPQKTHFLQSLPQSSLMLPPTVRMPGLRRCLLIASGTTGSVCEAAVVIAVAWPKEKETAAV